LKISLPDINVLIALHDPAHLGHEKAHRRFRSEVRNGWATCPLTENGFVRVLSQPQYPNNVDSVAVALHILQNMVSTYAANHQFWHDSPSLRDSTLFHASAIAGPKQIADVYLLGLCQYNGGRLITLDAGINSLAIPSPDSDLLCVL